MARYAIIEDGVVTNLVEATAKFAKSQGWVACPQGDVGWIWDGEQFEQATARFPACAHCIGRPGRMV